MTIVYTTIFGGSDSLKPAPVGADRCVCFISGESDYSDSQGWELIRGAYVEDPRRDAWYLRCVSHLQFPEADQTVWIDASFTVTDLPKLLADAKGSDLALLRHHKRHSCYDEGTELVKVGQSDQRDVQRQLAGYRREGFAPSALSISCILVRQNNPKVTAFNELWDREIQAHPGDNTQLSIDYCAWKTGLKVTALKGSRLDNPYSVHDVRDHRKRRKPYRPEHVYVR